MTEQTETELFIETLKKEGISRKEFAEAIGITAGSFYVLTTKPEAAKWIKSFNLAYSIKKNCNC
jgi:transcriptional regulator with XRE-family HTH domain